ncbi:MAG: ABC transporter ATP-binding protein [Phycisphaerales bacterium]|nr:MAG: ABC transporter ATP-binding protein [Phycisphaerales bacterium]
MVEDAQTPLLEVRNLGVEFVVDAGVLRAVDGVSLLAPCGKTVAIVGESGCGKSVTALSILRLIPQPPGRITGGQILFHDYPTANVPSSARTDAGILGRGEETQVPTYQCEQPVDLLTLSGGDIQRVRGGRIAMIFQDPLVSLNPVYTVGEQIVEAIELHQPLRGKAARRAAIDLLGEVGIAAPKQRVDEYPHQMSGGMLQRAMIAMALACEPALLIADEPTTALDVTIQSQILELLRQLQGSRGMSIIIITHDLGVVAEIADYVYVMYAGRIVEHASTDMLFAEPLHPYTQGLMRCMPRLGQTAGRLEVIPGTVPDPEQFPPGCAFHPRCQLRAKLAGRHGREAVAIDSSVGTSLLRRCVGKDNGELTGVPQLRESGTGHFVACWEVGGQ